MIYLDNAATTKIRGEVLEAMLPYLTEHYGNPSATYGLASEAANAIAIAREQVADLIGAKPHEIFFTSGGTEADNWALRGALLLGETSMRTAEGKSKRHIISSRIEHQAILRCLKRLEEEGLAEVTLLPVDREGLVSPADLKDALRPDTILVSIMAANNEIGSMEPLAKLADLTHEAGALFHTDAVQAFGQIPLDVKKLGVDLLSASAHKIYGPKGTGMLYVRETIPFRSMIQGGAQEKNRRAGTENVPGIVGFGAACVCAKKTLPDRMRREGALRNLLIKRAEEIYPAARLNGPRPKGVDLAHRSSLLEQGTRDEEGPGRMPDWRLPGNVNICFPGKSAELLLIMLEAEGILASAGSACASGSLDPSHVLAAIGLSEDDNRASLRFSLGEETSREEIEKTADALGRILK